MEEKSTDIREILGEVASIVEEKDKAYGGAVDEVGKFLKILFPNGILPEQFDDLTFILRIFDKLKRMARDPNSLNEDTCQDLIGYASLWLRSRRKRGL